MPETISNHITLTPAGVEALEGIARHYRLTTDDPGLKEFAADVELLARQYARLRDAHTSLVSSVTGVRTILDNALQSKERAHA